MPTKPSFLTRPEYVFQPRRAVRRLLRRSTASALSGAYSSQMTPWKASMRFKSGEELGRALKMMGIYDLSISEVLWRLTDHGEFVCDIGANIGYTAGILAARVGTKGKVLCFEPHPEIFADLKFNAERWKRSREWNQVECVPIALSDSKGTADLHIPVGFEDNRGIASLAPSENEDGSASIQIVSVETDTLDNVLSARGRAPQLIKLDVEGHELAVLQGGLGHLKEVRDLVFEEHTPHPAPTSALLQEQGFEIFRILKGFLNPVLVDPSSDLIEKMAVYWEPPNYLATRDPQRARERMAKKGWQCLRG